MKRFDAVATRPYTTKEGEEKKQYINVGRAVEFDDGGIQIELTTVPVGGWWNGKISLYEAKPKVKSSKPDDTEAPPF